MLDQHTEICVGNALLVSVLTNNLVHLRHSQKSYQKCRRLLPQKQLYLIGRAFAHLANDVRPVVTIEVHLLSWGQSLPLSLTMAMTGPFTMAMTESYAGHEQQI